MEDSNLYHAPRSVETAVATRLQEPRSSDDFRAFVEDEIFGPPMKDSEGAGESTRVGEGVERSVMGFQWPREEK